MDYTASEKVHHIIPLHEPNHVESERCPCNPKINWDYGTQFIIHNSFKACGQK
jgi:hypothetical protein